VCRCYLPILFRGGGGGSVVQCMQAGLIPVVSYEASVDIEGFGVELSCCTKEEIKKTIKKVTDISADKLEKMSRDAWRFAREHHTRENFAKKIQDVLTEIIGAHKKKAIGKCHHS